MSLSTALKLVMAVLLVALGYAAFALYEKLVLAREETRVLASELIAVKEAKNMSDKSIAKLTGDLHKNNTHTTEIITKLVEVPVSSDEKCMSPVLKESLKDD